MAITKNSIHPSATNNGVGPSIAIANLVEFTRQSIPGYSGGSQPNPDDRFVIKFLMSSGEKNNPVFQEWVFPDKADMDAEYGFIQFTISEVTVGA